MAGSGRKGPEGGGGEEAWCSAAAERNDLLLFNEVFRPLRARGAPVPCVDGVPGRRVSAGSAVSGEEGAASGGEEEEEARAEAKAAADEIRARQGSDDNVSTMPPRDPAGIVGRERFLRRLAKLMFERDERQIKVYGAEGSGKTAVAVEFVHAYRDKFEGGVVWVNGSTIVWDASHFLVDVLNLQAYVNVLEVEQLRQRLWKYLYDSREPWLLVIDDAGEEALEWIPPASMMRRGFVLTTTKAKSGRDECLRVELPLLSAKSLSDVVLRFAKARSCKAKVLSVWTDSFHLCRNLLGIRLIGLLCTTHGMSLEDLLERYDAALEKTVMPDLALILEKYKLKHHMSSLKSIGVLDTLDFIRGRPWTALEGLSRRELYLFEKIQENLNRSRNRLSTKLICKIWRDLALRDADGLGRGREVLDLFRACSFFSARYIPITLVAHELSAIDVDAYDATEHGDLMYTSHGALCVHPTLLDAIRSIHQKGNDKNRALGKRMLTTLHGHCMERLFPHDQMVVGVAECDDRAFRSTTMSLLPHVFLAVGLCSDLLLSPDDAANAGANPEDPDADFAGDMTPRRHSSLFSVASGGSASSVLSSSSSQAETRAEPKRRSSALVAGSGPLLKQITRRFTPKGKRSNVRLLIADLNVVQGLLLMLVQLGEFRVGQAETLFRRALQAYSKYDERAFVRSTKHLIAHCLLKRSKAQEAAAQWEELLDMGLDPSQKAFVLTSLGLAHATGGQRNEARRCFEDSLRIVETDLVGARTWAALGETSKPGQGESISALKSALAVYDDLCPLSFMSAETHKSLSKNFFEAGSLQEALVHAEEAIAIYSAASTEVRISQLSEAYGNMGLLHQATGDYDRAKEALARCLEHSDRLYDDVVDTPDTLEILRALRECCNKLGDAKEAERFAGRASDMKKRLNSWATIYSSLEL